MAGMTGACGYDGKMGAEVRSSMSNTQRSREDQRTFETVLFKQMPSVIQLK